VCGVSVHVCVSLIFVPFQFPVHAGFPVQYSTIYSKNETTTQSVTESTTNFQET
jgi:hypothetical protein